LETPKYLKRRRKVAGGIEIDGVKCLDVRKEELRTRFFEKQELLNQLKEQLFFYAGMCPTVRHGDKPIKEIVQEHQFSLNELFDDICTLAVETHLYSVGIEDMDKVKDLED
jgi:hypothetical protein